MLHSAYFSVTLTRRNYEGDAYPDYAASVLAGNDLFRSLMAAAFPLFAVQMFKNLEALNGPKAVGDQLAQGRYRN